MKDSKLLDILNILTAEECEDLDRFLDYSLPRTRHEVAADDIKRLWRFCYKTAKNFQPETLTIENTYALVFPERAFVKGRLEKTMSSLLRELEKWLSFRQITEGTSFEKKSASLHFLSLRQLNNRFTQTLDRLKMEYQRKTHKETTDFLDMYSIELITKVHLEHLNNKKGDLNLKATLDALDTHFIVSRLDMLLILIAQQRHIGVDISQDLAIFVDIENMIAKKNLEKNPLIRAFLLAIKLLLNQGDYTRFRHTLSETKPFLTFEQQRSLHAVERNYCSALFNQGQISYLDLLGDLNESHLEAGYLYYRNALIPSTLLNLTIVGTKLKRFDWVKKMLEDHKEKILSDDDPQEILRVAWAWYWASKGNYDAALKLLQSPFKFQDIYFDLVQRRLKIRAYIEKQDEELAASHNDALRNYLFNRSKKKAADFLPPSAFEPNNQFVNTIEKLLSLPFKDKNRAKQLLERIKQTKPIADYDWFLEKLNAIIDN